MIISIIGSNGMLSSFIAEAFFSKDNIVEIYGLNAPSNYRYNKFIATNLLDDNINYSELIKSDIIFYAAGAGVQAALKTESSLMYSLNVKAPIEITLQLKKNQYKGMFVSFGSYMEIGLNEFEDKVFSEDEIICSNFPVTNDYALSKRLYSRYMKDFISEFTHWHFILPNMFSYKDKEPGTRLIPYTLHYLQSKIKGREVVEPSFSAGLQKRQFILMEDIYNVLLKSIKVHLPSGVYNIGGGEYMSIRALIERIFSIYHVECKDNFFGKEVRRDGDIKTLCLDASKLQKIIGYLPEKKIDDILEND